MIPAPVVLELHRAATLGAEGGASITDVSIQWPTFEETLRTFTLQAGYNSAIVTAGTTMLGVAAGTIGVFALLRKRSLLGDALAHATLPGIALAFVVTTWLGAGSRSVPVLLGGGAVTGVTALLCVQMIVRHGRLREDAAIGAALSVFFGLGVVLLSYIQTLKNGNAGGLGQFIYGQTASMNAGDAQLIGATALLALIAAAFLLKEFGLVCFDDRFAAATGVPVAVVDLLMMALVVLVTVIGLQAVGLVLVVALLIIPGASARFWTDRLGSMTVLAAMFGGLSGYFGACASALLPRLPAGSVIVLSAGALFLLSMIGAPRRGAIASAVRFAALRRRVTRDHVLRSLFEAVEAEHGAVRAGASVPAERISPLRSIGGRWSGWIWSAVAARGLVQSERRPDGRRLSLTTRGASEAARLTRNHRLWELYLLRHADVAPTHVDLAADRVEHVLSADMMAALNRDLLEARARLDASEESGEAPVPPSPHPTDARRPGAASKASAG